MEYVVPMQMIQSAHHLIEEILHAQLAQASLPVLDVVVHVHVEQLRD